MKFQGDQPQYSINRQNKWENNIDYIHIQLKMCCLLMELSTKYQSMLDQKTSIQTLLFTLVIRDNVENIFYVLKNFGFHVIAKNLKNVISIT